MATPPAAPTPLWREKTTTGSVNAVAFSPGGTYLVSGADTGYVRLWATVNGEAVRSDPKRLPRWGVIGVGFGPRWGELVLLTECAAAGNKQACRLIRWDAVAHKAKAFGQQHYYLTGLATSPAGIATWTGPQLVIYDPPGFERESAPVTVSAPCLAAAMQKFMVSPP